MIEVIEVFGRSGLKCFHLIGFSEVHFIITAFLLAINQSLYRSYFSEVTLLDTSV